MIMAKEGRHIMKLLVVASLVFPALINAVEYGLEKSASYFEGHHALKKFALLPEPIITVKAAAKPPSPKPKSPRPKPKSPLPEPKSPPLKPKSPSPKPKSPPPKPKSPPPKPMSPPPKPKSPPPKPKSPPPEPKSPPPKPKSPPPKPKSPPPEPKSPPPEPKSPPPEPKSPPPEPKSPPPEPKSPPPEPKSPPPQPVLSPPPQPSPSPSPPLPSPLSPSPSPSLTPPLPSPLPAPEPSPAPSPPIERPPPPPPEPWDTHYMNLYTPTDPAGGLVLSDDRMHVDMKITSRQQIFGHFLSKNRFIYGYFSIYMKLIPRDSAGIIMTYYFSSPERSNRTEDTHDECDFEFLGNVSGQPITLQTNLYLNGRGNREVRHYLPFDPTEAMHKYSLLWNENLIIWYVDDEVIRVYHNRTDVPYPTFRPMAVQASVWNASDWATQGGKVKLNISNTPFILQYEGFNGVDGCRACDTYPMTDPSSACTNPDISHCSSGYWFNEQKELSTAEVAQLKSHTSKYVIYHYCEDYIRFANGFPPECAYSFG